MRTFVTGGSGFVGSAVVLELLRRGESVRALVRSRERLSNLAGLDVELVEGDLLDRESLRRAVGGIDCVYHIAAIYTNWMRDSGLIMRVNIEGTRNLLQACLDQGIERVVHTSSTAALGAHGKTPANESAQFNLADTRDAYHISKHLAERVVGEFHRKGLPVIVVNPTNPIGERDVKPTPTGRLILDLLKGKLPGYVDGGINIVDVEDVAAGHVLAMEHGKPGDNYILGNTNVSVKEYFQILAEVGGAHAPAIRIPFPLALATASVYEAVAAITSKPPITTVSWVKVGTRYSFWDSAKAVNELGLPQHPVRDSLRRAIEWFRSKGYLG